jgi:hypothetical protein
VKKIAVVWSIDFSTDLSPLNAILKLSRWSGRMLKMNSVRVTSLRLSPHNSVALAVSLPLACQLYLQYFERQGSEVKSC